MDFSTRIDRKSFEVHFNLDSHSKTGQNIRPDPNAKADGTLDAKRSMERIDGIENEKGFDELEMMEDITHGLG